MGRIDSLIIWFGELIDKDATMAVIVGTIAAALVGALVGALATYAVQWASDYRNQTQRIVATLGGIRAELNTIYRQLTSSYAKEEWDAFIDASIEKGLPDNLEVLEKSDLPFFKGCLRIPEDYLIVYRSNANLIGQIENSELQGKIVSDYMFLQITMDSYQKYSKLLDLYYDDDNDLIKQEFSFTSASYQLEKSSRKLLRDHEFITKSMESLLEMLEEEISLYGFFRCYRRFPRFFRR